MIERSAGMWIVGVLALFEACRCGQPGPEGKFDAHRVSRDVTPPPEGNPPDVIPPACPPWRATRPDGHEWLYVQAHSTAGTLLNNANDVAFFVRVESEQPPGHPAQPDDPCGVAAFDTHTPEVIVLATAYGFTSYNRRVAPRDCTVSTPCDVPLPPNLKDEYYAKASDGTVRVKTADEVGKENADDYAAAIGADALARTKALRGTLDIELKKSEQASNVPAMDLAIKVTEARLKKKKCNIQCLSDPDLDPELLDYFERVRKPGRDPFDLRTSPDRWRPER